MALSNVVRKLSVWGAVVALFGVMGCQHRPPEARFEVSPSPVFANQLVTFNAASSVALDGQISRYSWDFGDGNTAVGISISHLYADPGSYVVTLTVQASNGQSDSTSQQVEVLESPTPNQPPVADFSFEPSSPKASDEVHFTDASNDRDGQLKAWKWEFGDGNVSQEQNPVHRFEQAGEFTVHLLVTDDQGLQGQAVKKVTVLPQVAAFLDSFDSPAEDPRGLAFDGRYLWLSDALSLKLFKVDPATGEAVRSFNVDWQLPEDVAWDGTSIWAVDNGDLKLLQIDPETGDIIKSKEAPGDDPTGLTFDGTSLWVADATDMKLYQIDPATGDVLKTLEAPGTLPSGLAFDGQFLWLADPMESRIFKIRPSSGAVEDIIASFTGDPVGLAFDGQYLWQTDDVELVIVRSKSPILVP